MTDILVGWSASAGKYVLWGRTVTLCGRCERLEYSWFENGRFVRRTYLGGRPVFHR